MTHVTCRLTTKNRDQLRNPTFGNRVLATFFTSDYLRYLKKTICNPLAHPTWKYTKLTCEVPNFFYLTEGLHCTCVFRTCVFHPCEMRCFVLDFSILAFSSTCVFSAPLQILYTCRPCKVLVLWWVFLKWAWSGSREQFLHCWLRKFRHSKSSVYRWYTQLDRCRFVYCLQLNLQLHRPTIGLVSTCRISSFCTVAW